MDLSSLPSYPPPPHAMSAGTPVERDRRLSPRQARIFFDLARLAAIVVLLVWLRPIVDATRQPVQPAEPLAFEVLQQRFARVTPGMREKEVFARLGPPNASRFWEPEFEDTYLMVEARPDRYPGECYWAKWADPKDEGKWAAVFFVGGYVFKVLKKGF